MQNCARSCTLLIRSLWPRTAASFLHPSSATPHCFCNNNINCWCCCCAYPPRLQHQQQQERQCSSSGGKSSGKAERRSRSGAASIAVLRRSFSGSGGGIIMTQDGPEMREKAYRLCRDYLSGAWKRISSSEMIFNPIRGGLSNILFYCALPNTLHPVGNEPAQVLLRMYGQIHDEGVEAVITQSVIFTLLSERCLGPKLFGVFPGGRLEEYIPSRSLKTSELSDPELSCIIAGKLAQVHSLTVPISKEPTWIFDTMLRWINYVQENIQLGHAPKDDKPKVKKLLSFALEKEFDWIKRTLLKVGSPVVFCHNDLQEGNILIHENAKGREEKLVLIDFEYCSYNYRGFDFANHFCEWCYDYSNTSPPYFKSCLAHYPNRDQQLRFLKAYLEKMDLTPAPNSGLPNNAYHYQNSEDAMLKEINTFTLASHFFWGLWSIVNAHVSQIPFGYWDYALARFEAYFQHKARILAENNKRKAPTGIE